MEQQTKPIDLEMVKSRMDREYCLISIHWDDNFDDRHDIFRECIEQRSADPLHEFFEYCFLYSEYMAASDAMEEIERDLVRDGYRRWKVEKFFDENEDAILEEIYNRSDNDTIEKILRNTADIPVRVEMYSNHDCINSHWFESQGGFRYYEYYSGGKLKNIRDDKQRLIQSFDYVIK